MNFKKIITPLLLSLLIGFLVVQKMNEKAEKQNGKAGGGGKPGMKGPVAVNAIKIKTTVVPQNIQSGGTLLADEQTELRFETNGKITSIHFEEGKAVRKGELLVKMEDATLRAQEEKIKTQVKLFEDLEKRQKELLGKEGISMIDYLRTQSDLDAARADLQLVREQIKKTSLLAPFDGTIGLKWVSVGAVVGPETRIAAIQNIQKIKVEFNLPEKYAGRISRGSDIEFVGAGSNKTYHAKVYAIEPTIDPATRNMVIRAIAQNDGQLFPGAFVNVKVALQTIPDAIMVPTASIIPVLKGQKVYTAKGDSVVEKMVKIGLRTGDALQITEGLAPGDTLITSALMQLKKGAKIKVVQIK
jgi:membrane fusion protein (multidrug efflux system)